MYLVVSIISTICVSCRAVPHTPATVASTSPKLNPVQAKIIKGARQQVLEAADYTQDYYSLSYPGGDPPRNKGACTDVVIRALREAGYDLQKLIHEDMKKHFSEYPRRGETVDANIDHRRCPNQMHFFKKFGKSLTTKVDKQSLASWQPGDIVYWKIGGRLDHTGVVSDRFNANGEPLVFHNISKCTEQDALTAWPIVAHFRYPKAKTSRRSS